MTALTVDVLADRYVIAGDDPLSVARAAICLRRAGFDLSVAPPSPAADVGRVVGRGFGSLAPADMTPREVRTGSGGY